MSKKEWYQYSVLTTKFYERMKDCKHVNLSPDYCVRTPCETPFCSKEEVHCLDCGAYISKCGCGYMDDISGWSNNRRHNWLKKRNRRNETKRTI